MTYRPPVEPIVHALLTPWPIGGPVPMVTWCAMPCQGEGSADLVATRHGDVTCARCRRAMRQAFANLGAVMTDARIRMLELALDEQAERIERLRAAMPSEDDLAVYMLPHDLDRAALDAYLDELVTAIAALRDGDL